MFEEPVTAYVQSYAAEHNQPFDEGLQAQTATIIDEATAIVGSHTMLFNLDNVIAFPQFQTVRKMLQTVLAYFYLVPLAFFLIAGALVGLNWKLPHRSLIWIGSGLVSGSAFVIIPAIVALVLKIPQRITVSADYINTALRTLALHYTTFFLGSGALVFVLGIACLVGYNSDQQGKTRCLPPGSRLRGRNGTILIHHRLTDALKGGEKYMKKVIVSLLFAFALFFGAQPNVAAATENDIISTLEASSLPSNYVQQAKNYLMSNDVTAEEADQIIVHINNAQAVVNARGAKSVNQLTQADGQAILAELTAAAAILDMTVTMNSKEIIIYGADGTVVATFPTKGNDVKQTGANNLYLAGGISLLVAAAGAAVVAKKRFQFAVEA